MGGAGGGGQQRVPLLSPFYHSSSTSRVFVLMRFWKRKQQGEKRDFGRFDCCVAYNYSSLGGGLELFTSQQSPGLFPLDRVHSGNTRFFVFLFLFMFYVLLFLMIVFLFLFFV